MTGNRSPRREGDGGSSRRRQTGYLLLTLLLLLAGPALLIGCALPDELVAPLATPTDELLPTPSAEATAVPEPLTPTITFWEPYALDRPQGLLLAEMVRDFEAANPDVAVTLEARAGYVGIHSAMLAAPETGELPDLAVAFPEMIAQYADAGIVAPLDPYVVDFEFGLSEADLADLFPALLEAGRFPHHGRQLLAFPFAQNAVGMWVNRTLLAQAGWERPPATWAEFEQACTDVLANTGSRCYPYVESVPTFQAWLRSRGGRLLDPDGRQATFNSPVGVESLALLRRLESAGLAWRPGEPFGDYVAFANGQAAFSFSSTGNSPFYLDAYEGAVQNGVPPFDWYQTIIPQVDPGQPATGLYGASFFVVRGDSEQELRAWRLIRWFTEPQQTARWAATLQAMPVRLSALDHMSDTLAAHPFVAVQVGEILPYARPAPAVAASVDVNNLLYNAILSVTYGYTEPQIALDRAATEANRLLATEP